MGSDFAERPLRLVEQNQVPCVSNFFYTKFHIENSLLCIIIIDYEV